MNKTAHFSTFQCKQKGIVTPPILIAGVVIVVLIIIGVASGALKGSFKVTTNNQSAPQAAEETTQETNLQATPAPTSAPVSTSSFKKQKGGYSKSRRLQNWCKTHRQTHRRP